MNNILLLDTSVGSLNLGDEIINIMIKRNWKELFDENYIMRLATHTPLYSYIQTKIYREKLSVFKNADYKFLCGTNALYTNMLRPLPTWNINIFNHGLVEGTICLGVGIGINSKKTNWYTKNLYDKVLNHDYIHSTRDEETKLFLESMGFKAMNTGCPTLWSLTPEHCKTISSKKGSRVVFTLTYYERDKILDKMMVDILISNYSEVYFWPQCIKDLDYLKELTNIDDINIIPSNVKSFEKVLRIENTDYVGNRLHGGIYALNNYCRSIIISIDYRAEKMRKNYSFECLKREQIPDLLDSRLNDEWETNITGINFSDIDKWKRQFI